MQLVDSKETQGNDIHRTILGILSLISHILRPGMTGMTRGQFMNSPFFGPPLDTLDILLFEVLCVIYQKIVCVTKISFHVFIHGLDKLAEKIRYVA